MRLLLLFTICSLSACVPSTQDFSPNILGGWQYQVIETSSGNTYDQGSMVFRGSVSSGSFILTNFYDIDYEGQYTVDVEEKSLSLSESGTTYIGFFSNPDTLRGTWEGNDTSGTWEASRK
jgi:hypothetical protein